MPWKKLLSQWCSTPKNPSAVSGVASPAGSVTDGPPRTAGTSTASTAVAAFTAAHTNTPPVTAVRHPRVPGPVTRRPPSTTTAHTPSPARPTSRHPLTEQRDTTVPSHPAAARAQPWNPPADPG